MTRRSFGSARQLPSGRWQARYPLDGRRVTLASTFPTRRAALAALAQVESDLQAGAHVDPRHGRETVAAFGARYLAARVDWAATTRQDRCGLWDRHVVPAFGHLHLAQVTPTMVKSWHADLYRRHPATATGAYRLLRQIMGAAIVEKRVAGTNPCSVKGAGSDRSPERQIATVAEVETIVAAMPERMRLVVLLATYVGLRRSELLGLRRRDVNVLRREISVAQTVHHLRDGAGMVVAGPKTKAGRRTVAVPLSILDDVDDHLARHTGPGRDALLFTGERGGPLLPHVLGAAFRRARTAAGRPELTLHDLRHTANTLAAATGATLPELMHRMGHATPHSALRYLHATVERDHVIARALAELRPNAPVVDLTGKLGHVEGTKSG